MLLNHFCSRLMTKKRNCSAAMVLRHQRRTRNTVQSRRTLCNSLNKAELVHFKYFFSHPRDHHHHLYTLACWFIFQTWNTLQRTHRACRPFAFYVLHRAPPTPLPLLWLVRLVLTSSTKHQPRYSVTVSPENWHTDRPSGGKRDCLTLLPATFTCTLTHTGGQRVPRDNNHTPRLPPLRKNRAADNVEVTGQRRTWRRAAPVLW